MVLSFLSTTHTNRRPASYQDGSQLLASGLAYFAVSRRSRFVAIAVDCNRGAPLRLQADLARPVLSWLLYLKMFTARATTSRTVTDDTVASVSIKLFANRVSGIVSVGLNAIELVKETYR
jgi:hypothetical protein